MNTPPKQLKLDLIPRVEVRREADRMTKEEQERIARIEMLAIDVSTKLNQHLAQEDKITPKLEEVIEIFVQAQGVLKFVKICASVSAAIAAAYLFIREFLHHLK